MKLTRGKSFISLLGSKYPALVFTGQVYTNDIQKSITSVDFSFRLFSSRATSCFIWFHLSKCDSSLHEAG